MVFGFASSDISLGMSQVNSVITYSPVIFSGSKPLDRKTMDEAGCYSANTVFVDIVIATVFLVRYFAYVACYSVRS